jgi:hypothetical protein
LWHSTPSLLMALAKTVLIIRIKLKILFRTLQFLFRTSLSSQIYFRTKMQFWYFLEGLEIKNFESLVHFVVIGFISCPFGLFYAHLLYFPHFGIFIVWRKIWQPCRKRFQNLSFYLQNALHTRYCT